MSEQETQTFEVHIGSIVNPTEFYIVSQDEETRSKLNQISQVLSENAKHFEFDFEVHLGDLIAVRENPNSSWKRARLKDAFKELNGRRVYDVFLIDDGKECEIRDIRKNVRKLANSEICHLPPIAKKFQIFGLVPIQIDIDVENNFRTSHKVSNSIEFVKQLVILANKVEIKILKEDPDMYTALGDIYLHITKEDLIKKTKFFVKKMPIDLGKALQKLNHAKFIGEKAHQHVQKTLPGLEFEKLPQFESTKDEEKLPKFCEESPKKENLADIEDAFGSSDSFDKLVASKAFQRALKICENDQMKTPKGAKSLYNRNDFEAEEDFVNHPKLTREALRQQDAQFESSDEIDPILDQVTNHEHQGKSNNNAQLHPVLDTMELMRQSDSRLTFNSNLSKPRSQSFEPTDPQISLNQANFIGKLPVLDSNNQPIHVAEAFKRSARRPFKIMESYNPQILGISDDSISSIESVPRSRSKPRSKYEPKFEPKLDQNPDKLDQKSVPKYLGLGRAKRPVRDENSKIGRSSYEEFIEKSKREAESLKYQRENPESMEISIERGKKSVRDENSKISQSSYEDFIEKSKREAENLKKREKDPESVEISTEMLNFFQKRKENQSVILSKTENSEKIQNETAPNSGQKRLLERFKEKHSQRKNLIEQEKVQNPVKQETDFKKTPISLKSAEFQEIMVHRDPSSRKYKPIEEVTDLIDLRVGYSQNIEELGLLRPRHNIQKRKLAYHTESPLGGTDIDKQNSSLLVVVQVLAI